MTSDRLRAMSVLAGAIVVATAGGGGSSKPAHGIGGNDGAVDVPPDGLYVPPPAGRIDTSLDDGWRFQRADVPGAAMPGLDDSRGAMD